MIKVKYQGSKPTKGSELAAGYDLRSSAKVVIKPRSCAKVVSDTRIQPPSDYLHIAVPRSSICNKKGLILMNSVGVIDPDYTGNTIWNFWNLSEEDVIIEEGERIGQVVFMKRIEVDFVNECFIDTERGDNGFGSSGKH